MSKERGTLMPEPPVGQLSDEKIMAANLHGLEKIAEQRGLRLNSVRSSVPKHLELPSLFKEERWERMGVGRELSIAPMWTREHNIRFALLQMDGRSAQELADIFHISVVSAERRMSNMRTWLSPEFVEIPGAARMTRKWHELLHPPTKESEDMLRQLQRRVGMMPRDVIFRHPGERLSTHDEKIRPGRTVAARTMLDYDIIIKILHMRFYQKLSVEEVLKAIEPEVGPQSAKKLQAFYSRVLTEDALEMLGIKKYKPWSFPQYVKAASMFLSNEAVEYDKVAQALGRPEGSTRAGIYMAGKRLVESNEEYAGLAPLAALILEYGPRHLFPHDQDPKTVAKRIHSLHTRDESAPTAHMLAKRKSGTS